MTIEQEILRVEREYWQLGDPGAIAKRIAALEQSLMARWMYVDGPPGAPAPNTTFSGVWRKCVSGGAGSGLAVTIKDSLGATLWTGTTATSAGDYSGSLYLASTQTLTVSVAGPNVRWAATSSFAASFTAGGTVTLGSHAMGAATGYACTPANACDEPVNTTLNLTSDGVCSGGIYPNDTLTYQARDAALAALIGAGNSWVGAAVITRGGLTYHYWYNGGPNLSIYRTGSSLNIASGGASVVCPVVPGTNFSWAPPCGGGTANAFGGTISE